MSEIFSTISVSFNGKFESCYQHTAFILIQLCNYCQTGLIVAKNNLRKVKIFLENYKLKLFKFGSISRSIDNAVNSKVILHLGCFHVQIFSQDLKKKNGMSDQE